MNYIKDILQSSIPFYLASIPLIILNIYLIKEKRKYMNIQCSNKEVVCFVGFMLSILFILSCTIGNNSGIRFKDISWGNINLVPFNGIYIQYISCFKMDIYSILNLFGNIIICIPWGFFLAMYLKRDKNKKYKFMLITIIMYLVIEIIQLFSGRCADITDILLNTVGSILGCGLYSFLSTIFNNFFDSINLKYSSNDKKVKTLSIIQIFCCGIVFICNLV